MVISRVGHRRWALPGLCEPVVRWTLCVLVVGVAWRSVVCPAWAAPEKANGGIRFTYENASAGNVFWAGDFNGWNATANPMTKGSDGVWSIVLDLGTGEHQYKFIVDGDYIADPDNAAVAGDFNNSVVTVGADGELIEQEATSNTPYSANILLGGRIIGLYLSDHNDDTGRFELDRPNIDIDLNLGIRVSSLLRARFLLNINSQASEVDFFRTGLNFDRGSLDFRQPTFQIFAYDNEGADTWDDPMHLVGNIGIYDYQYGYNRQGFRFNLDKWNFDGELHYADNFSVGGTSFPGLGDDATNRVIGDFELVPVDSGYVFSPGSQALLLSRSISDANEDMLAARLGYTALKGTSLGSLRLGALARGDRGFDLGTIAAVEALTDSTVAALEGDGEQIWYAYGGEANWTLPFGLGFYGEYLRGKSEFELLGNSTRSVLQATEIDTGGIVTEVIASETGSGEKFEVSGSDRIKLGINWTESNGDAEFDVSAEYQDLVFKELEGAGLDNSMVIYRGIWNRNWRYYLNRQVKTFIDFEYTDFTYQDNTPWAFQFWFPNANFWLEHNTSKVRYDRLTMLGGDDAITIRPGIELPLFRRWQMTFKYMGTFNTVSLENKPRYYESIFQFGFNLSKPVRLQGDVRWAGYDDPVLEINEEYMNYFAEAIYQFTPQISLALSYGVDPWVVDFSTNEYAYIGRDRFLMNRGANAVTARDDYRSLSAVIPAAEKALQDEQRIQLEGIIHF
jgi:hypothetical protein